MNRCIWILQYTVIFLGIAIVYADLSQAADVRRFLEPRAWQCAFESTLSKNIEKATGAGGMANSSKRQLFQALEKTGLKVENVTEGSDSYREEMNQSVQGQIRLHHVYDGGLDGIQIAGWNNGKATVHIKNSFEGSEQNKTIFREKTMTFDGVAHFEGEEYEPPFQIWIYPDQGTYTFDYHLPPVRGSQVEHCRMMNAMEGDRKKLESATDADMPLGTLFSGLTKVTCATERKVEVEIDGGVLSATVEDVRLPDSGLMLRGTGKDTYSGSMVSWTCQPE